MKHIRKINEFLNESEIISLIEKAESTPSSDLVNISKRKSYRDVVNLGKSVIPYLIERNSILWDIALRELTGDGLESENHSTSERIEYWKNWAIENGYNKFNDFKEVKLKMVSEKLNSMEMGLDLTKSITGEYVMQKTLEYINESKER